MAIIYVTILGLRACFTSDFVRMEREAAAVLEAEQSWAKQKNDRERVLQISAFNERNKEILAHF